MQSDYIVDRWLVRAARQICQKRNIEMQTYSDDWILELRKSGKVGRFFGYKCSLNDSVAANLAQDKVAAYQLMTANGVPAVLHELLRTKVGVASSHTMSGEVVLKPLVGTSGHLVMSFKNMDDVYTYITGSKVEAWTVSPRLHIRSETRLILLDQKVLLSYKKHPADSDGLTMFNLGRGAIPEDITPTPDMEKLAVDAQKALGLRLCAVDVIETDSGEQMVLEVNDGIMMEYYSRHSGQNSVRAYEVYDQIIRAMI